MFIAALFTTAERWKQSMYPSTYQQGNKICTQQSIVYFHKGNSDTCCNKMDLEDATLNKIAWS